MSQILVRNMNEKLVKRLKDRAKRQGRSLQAEVKDILENAVAADPAAALRLADKIRRSWGKTFDDSARLIREDRDR